MEDAVLLQDVVLLHIEIAVLKSNFQISAYVAYGYGCVIMKTSLRRDENITQVKNSYPL